LAGRDVTEHLQLLLRKQGSNFATSAEFEIVKQIKEKKCRVSLNAMKEEKEYIQKEAFVLPDGNSIKVSVLIQLGNERFNAPEVLFQPHRIGLESQGIHQLLVDSINRVDLGMSWLMQIYDALSSKA
jgi:centractin